MAEPNDFERRLRDARARQGLDPAPGGRGALPGGRWGVGFRVGVELFSALLVGILIGWSLDRWLGTSPWLLVLFFFVGSAAGVLNVFRAVSPRRGAKPP